MSNSVIFAFIDESVSRELDLASLTAVLVPSEQYAGVRDAVIRLGVELQRPPPNTIPAPIEFHGCEMLKSVEHATDDDRILAFDRLVGIVNAERLPVLSVGYTNWSELSLIRKHDDKLHGLNFIGMLTGLQSLLARGTLVVPVVDGIPGGILDAANRRRTSPVERDIFMAFIGNVRYGQHLRVAGGQAVESSLSIEGYGNLADPVFSDSAMSPLLQLADVVSYLLTIRDAADRAAPSGFKARVLAVANRLDESLLKTWRGAMNMKST